MDGLKILFLYPMAYRVPTSPLEKFFAVFAIYIVPVLIVRNAIRYFKARKEGEVARVKQSMAALTGWFSVFFFCYGLLHTSPDVSYILKEKDLYPYNLQLAIMSFFFVSSSVMFAASCIIRAGYQGD
jgi:DMSO/TMAO reductase YedYZ heme-binding membrane subunit